MNLVLTTKCNKNCNFCFSNGTHNSEYPEMYLDDLEFLIKNSNQRIGLLGGEPTQRVDLERIFSICLNHKKIATLISNLLFKDEVVDIIEPYIKSRTIQTVLANASYLDIKDRFRIFKSNYDKLLQYYEYYNFSTPEKRISIGLTIEQHLSTEYYINYFKNLINNLNFKRLRISLDYPSNPSKKRWDKYIDDKNTGETLYQIWQMCQENNIFFAGDCNFYPCMFEEHKYKDLMTSDNTEIFTICKGTAADISPDMVVSHCYPTKNNLFLDIKEVENLKIINEEYILNNLLRQYDERFSIDLVPEKCKSCKFFKNQECEGPCLGLLL